MKRGTPRPKTQIQTKPPEESQKEESKDVLIDNDNEEEEIDDKTNKKVKKIDKFIPDENTKNKLVIVPKSGAKDPKNVILLNLKRKRSKKQNTEIQDLLNKIYKANATTEEGIANVLSKNNKYIGNKDTIKFLKTIAETKVNNQKIVLSDRISNIPMYEYCVYTFYDVEVLSNDILYLWTNLISSVTAEADEDTKKIVNMAKFAEVTIVSNLFDGDNEINQGYLQDYNGDFCAINVGDLEKTERDALFKFQDNPDYRYNYIAFDYNGRQFQSCGNENALLVTPINMTQEEALDTYNNMKIIKDNNSKIDLGFKTLPIKNNKTRFISCKLKSEDFCPCFMNFQKPISVQFLYKIKLDNNKLFEYFDEQLKSYKNKNSAKLKHPHNILYWDNIESFFDFLQVYVVTSTQRVLPIFGTYLMAIQTYLKYKNVIQYWKQNQLEYQKILYEFYNSFTSRLNFDKLMKLYDRLKKYIGMRAILMGSETYKDIKNMFYDLKDLCHLINQQFENNTMVIGDRLLELLEELSQQKIKNIKDYQTIAYAIYCSSYNDILNSIPAFPFLLSPGGFLGDVSKDYRFDVGIFDELMDTLKNSVKKVKLNNQEYANNMFKAIDFAEKNRRRIIGNTIDYFCETNKYELSNEQREHIIENVEEAINDDEELRKHFNWCISEMMLEGADPNKDTVDIKEIDELIDSGIKEFNKEVDKSNKTNKKKLKELKDQRNELDDQIQEAEEEYNQEEDKKITRKVKKKRSSSDEKKTKTYFKPVIEENEEGKIPNIQQSQMINMDETLKRYQGASTKPPAEIRSISIKTRKSQKQKILDLNLGKKNVIADRKIDPSKLLGKFMEVNQNKTKNFETPNEELIGPRLNEALIKYVYGMLHNNGLDKIFNLKDLGPSNKLLLNHPKFYEFISENLKDIPDEVIDQAFKNDKFDLKTNLDMAHTSGKVEQYPIVSDEVIGNRKQEFENFLQGQESPNEANE